jgi:hypothetical protein
LYGSLHLERPRIYLTLIAAHQRDIFDINHTKPFLEYVITALLAGTKGKMKDDV